MISNEFYRFFVERHVCDGQFVKMARAMGMKDANKPEDFLTALAELQKACGVDNLRMSDYGITKAPNFFSAGIGSPVIMLSSIVVFPSMISPSTEFFSWFYF